MAVVKNTKKNDDKIGINKEFITTIIINFIVCFLASYWAISIVTNSHRPKPPRRFDRREFVTPSGTNPESRTNIAPQRTIRKQFPIQQSDKRFQRPTMVPQQPAQSAPSPSFNPDVNQYQPSTAQ